MLKRISVTQLRLGMFVKEFCGSWIEHPFWFSRSAFLLDDPRDLQRIQASSIKEVWIDSARGADVAEGVEFVSEAETHGEAEAALREALGAATAEIDSLRDALAAATTAQPITATAAAEIASLQQALLQSQDEVRQLVGALDVERRQIAQLERALAEAQARIATLAGQVAEREGRLEEMGAYADELLAGVRLATEIANRYNALVQERDRLQARVNQQEQAILSVANMGTAFDALEANRRDERAAMRDVADRLLNMQEERAREIANEIRNAPQFAMTSTLRDVAAYLQLAETLRDVRVANRALRGQLRRSEDLRRSEEMVARIVSMLTGRPVPSPFVFGAPTSFTSPGEEAPLPPEGETA